MSDLTLLLYQANRAERVCRTRYRSAGDRLAVDKSATMLYSCSVRQKVAPACCEHRARDNRTIGVQLQDDSSTVRIPLRAKDGSVRAYAIVDADCPSSILDRTWSVGGNGYAVRTDWQDGKARRGILHREILGLGYGDRRQGDHINRDKLDNRRANLRIVEGNQNQQNQASVNPGRGTSRYRGVFWIARKRRWAAEAKINGKAKRIGYFTNEEDAARAASEYRAKHMPFSDDARGAGS